MKNSFFLDKWLRPVGAFFLVSIGLSSLILSFMVREGKNFEGKKSSVTGKILFYSSFVENWFYDFRSSRFYQHDRISPNLVILEISDSSLAAVGRWPWSRSQHAKILDNLKKYGAKVVMFDVLFPEPESDAADKALAAAIARFSADNKSNVYIGYGVTTDPTEALSPVPDAMQLSGITGRPGTNKMTGASLIDKNNFTAPNLLLFEAKYGFINASPDMDGVFRNQQLINEIDGTFFPSLGFGGFADFHANGKESKVMVEPAPSDEYRLRIISGAQENSVILSSRGELKVRFFGGMKNFIRVPIQDVVNDKDPDHNQSLKSLMNGKAVLIGSSAFGAHDLRHTPLDPQTPGMLMHANLFHALDQNYFYRPDDENLVVSLALFFIGLLGVLAIFRQKSPLVESLGTLALGGSIFASDYFYFAPQGYFIRLFFCLFVVLGLHAWFSILNAFHEAREKKKIRDTFTRYVAPEIVKEMLANPEKLKVGGEKKEITMLFSDVRDFTSISERLTATELATLLNIYMGKMTDILFETGGTLDKYIGDAMVGFWGAPLEIKNHAYHAVRGAQLMLEALPAINAEFESRKFPRINVGIGLNTGEVSVGNMGSDKIFQYTALGDNMNLASRLESLTKYYGVNLMISEFTLEKLGEKRSEFRLRPLDLVQVKGKSKAVKIYEVIPSWNPWAKEEKLLQKFKTAYEELYLTKKFPEAIALFEEILHSLPEDKCTHKLLDSAKEFLANPPPENWDGVTIFQTK